MYFKLRTFVTCFQFFNILFTTIGELYKTLEDGTVLYRKSLGENEVLLTIQKEFHFLSRAYLKTSMNETGWNILEIQSNEHNDDESQAYYGGLAEGCISAQLIYQHWYNTKRRFCKRLVFSSCEETIDYITKNDEWVHNEIKKRKHKESYWWQVNLNYVQLNGLMEGYNMCRINGTVELSYFNFLLLNMDGDVKSLGKKFMSPERKLQKKLQCTGVIRLLPKNEDLYVSHSSWMTYNYMTRMLKNYILKYKIDSHSKTVIPGGTITFSGFPGAINSGDDFYTISSSIAVKGTHIVFSKLKLWELVSSIGSVPGSIRIMAANRLATDGKSWADIFKKFNSGTHNSQWTVVDYNKFKSPQPPQPGLLWVIEEIPSFVESRDLTSVLVDQTYWPSYNIPYYETVRNIGGRFKLEEKYRDWYDHIGNRWEKTMKTDDVKFHNFHRLMKFIHSDNYALGNLSVGANGNPLSNDSSETDSRFLLIPKHGTCPIPDMQDKPKGEIDAKITNSSLVKNLQFLAVSGPAIKTGLPAFKWSESGFEIKHIGFPDEWDFKPVMTKWKFK